MEQINEDEIYTDSKELPKEYLVLKLRMIFNKELFEKKIIPFDIYNKMQKMLITKMNKVILEFKT